jgi:hypothetical protein
MWHYSEQESFFDHRYITFRIEKHKAIMNGYNYNGVYITSEFEDNFIKEIKNNFRIRETLNVDNTLCEIITLESDTENVVGKYQNSLVAASKKSFKKGNYCKKNYWIQVDTVVDGRTYHNEKEN